ncbi:chemotaxis protein CheW [Massilia sp. YIM B02769]|jgi:twitching motility protein PilI|uniref:chemotaxis protein CheW n=1 Tax=unclassified Massilia TaxID=2609279 RepID=UPI0025B663B7|nr:MULTISPECIES: chemotaxis protein CheW [unclassified Massilia]MDN4057919.1 chemotaxis protein CheW [Massilia sp. YIM B02769]
MNAAVTGPDLAPADPAAALSAPSPHALRRTRLRDYQAQLLARVQAAQDGSTQAVHQLGVSIGGQRYLLELAEAGEIVPPVALARVPRTQPWYLGLANIRGSLLGVVDLARYLDPKNSAAGPDARFLSLAPRLGLKCALLVTQVHGLRRAEAMTPDTDAGALRLVDADGQAWTPLSLAALAQEERFLHVGL